MRPLLFLLCRRLRKAMVNPLRERLVGTVEVDDFFVGGAEKDVCGRGTKSKVVCVAAVENRGTHASRIRLEVIPDASGEVLHSFVNWNVAPGSRINTDGWSGYSGLGIYGYQHKPRIQGTQERAGKVLPWVHRVIGNLKTWLRGTHQGVDPEHLQEYRDEYTFRFNRRHIREQGFLSLLIIATRVKPLNTRKGILARPSGYFV